jgi:hypothetical protein
MLRANYGDGRLVAHAFAGAPLRAGFARQSVGVSALPASRWRTRLLAASGDSAAMCGRASPGATCGRA